MKSNGSLRDAILATTPEAAHRGILETALRYGITDPEDPIWAMVGLAWAATEGGSLARERLEIIRREADGIPEQIVLGTKRAGEEIRTMFGAELQERVREFRAILIKEIGQAAQSGATSIRQAQANLDGDIQRKKEAVLQEWTAAIGKAASSETSRAYARSWQMAWTTIGVSLLVAMVIGSLVTIGGIHLMHRMTPGWIEVWQEADGESVEVQFSHPKSIINAPECLPENYCLQIRPRESQ